MGLAAYRYLAQRLGDATETTWATGQYDSLLAATNSTLDATIGRYHLDYLPCSMVQPNSSNRCHNPEDANWAAPIPLRPVGLGRIALRGHAVGPRRRPHRRHLRLRVRPARRQAPGQHRRRLPRRLLLLLGLQRRLRQLGPGQPEDHRDQGILGYEFMIDHSQSGPYSWWESADAPERGSPWVGSHPGGGQGSSPHSLGHRQRQQGAPGLPGRAAIRRLARSSAAASPTPGCAAARPWRCRTSPPPTEQRLGFTISAHGGSRHVRPRRWPTLGPGAPRASGLRGQHRPLDRRHRRRDVGHRHAPAERHDGERRPDALAVT